MTSTSINIGLSDNTRLSSRVLRPPGGGHTDIFGGEPEPPRTGRRMISNPAFAAATAATAAAVAANATAEEAVKPTTTENPVESVAEQPSPAAPTTEPAQATDAPAAAPRQQTSMTPQPASTRVRVPPGGFSSGLW